MPTLPRRRAPWPGVLLAALLLLLAACGERGPQPIAYGSDSCAHCRMTITDDRFGSELVTRKGKVYKFDSVECLAAYYLEQHTSDDVHSLWVTDYRQPGGFLPADSAVFVHGRPQDSPMGMGLMAFADRAAADARSAEVGGRVLRWPEVLELVSRQGMRHGADAHSHGGETAPTPALGGGAGRAP